MRTAEVIQKEIDALQEQLSAAKGRPTEVYSRIVGYYRSVANWNKGKREEYDHRTVFDQPGTMPLLDEPPRVILEQQSNAEHHGIPSSYLFFQRSTCPNCPAMKSVLHELPSGLIKRTEISVDSEQELAEKHNIFSVPTVIFLDNEGTELMRTGNPREARAYVESVVTTTATA